MHVIINREVNVVSETNQGIVLSYRRGPKTQKPKEYILSFSGIESVGRAAQLIGRKVAWRTRRHGSLGKIVAVHGKNGLVRARFRHGIPGEALQSRVVIVG